MGLYSLYKAAGQAMAHLNGAWYCVWEHDTVYYEFYYLRNVLPTHEYKLCGQKKYIII